jgi:hypothetical protein
VGSNTYTDVLTAASGTVTSIYGVALNAPGFAASNTSVTYSNAATMFIGGAPTTGTNITITNAYSLYVNGGAAYFGGTLTTNSNFSSVGLSTLGNGQFVVQGNLAAGSTGNTSLIFGGAATTWYRSYTLGTTSTSLTVSSSYGSTIIGSSPITTYTSGTHPVLANMVVNPLGTVTNAGATVTTTASLYVNGAGSGGTSNYSMYITNGQSYFGGGLTIPVAQKIKITTGTNAIVGQATLVAGTVTVSTTSVTASSLIYLTVATSGGTRGFLSYTLIAGTSFTINSTSSTDTSVVNWWIIN